MENQEYDIESMLEYIEDLESQLDEINRASFNSDWDYQDSNKSKKPFEPDYRTKEQKRQQARQKPETQYKQDLRTTQTFGLMDKLKKLKQNESLDSDEESQLDEAKKSKKKSTCNENIESMLEYIMSGELVESKQSFADILGAKIAAKLTEAKIAVAQSLFGVVESKDEDEDDKSSEVDETEENKHPLIQLKKIASSEEGIPLKYPETVASGEPDKRSIRAATDRIKSGKSTSGVPKFKHSNGEESTIHPEHAQHLVDILSGSALKPDTKKAVLDHIHGSKAGLDKVSAVLGSHKPKEKSIYGADTRT